LDISTEVDGKKLEALTSLQNNVYLTNRGEPHVTVIVPAWNGADTLADCLNSVFSSKHRNIDVIVVDNASTDGTLSLLSESFPNARVIRNRENLGPGGAFKQATSLSTGEYLLWLNQDVILDSDWISQIVRAFQTNPRLAMASSIVVYSEPRDMVWSAGGRLDGFTGLAWDFGKGERVTEVLPLAEPDYVAGCASILRRQALDSIGGVDPNYFLYFEDADLGLRLKAMGYELAILAAPTVLHKGLHQKEDARNPEKKLFFFVRSNVRFVVKNWPFPRLMMSLGACLGFYLLFATIKGPSIYVPSVLKAAAWNIRNIRTTLRERVQNGQRGVPGNRFGSLSSFIYKMARRPELYPY
jgi:GT2 family glycosyltransferase